MTKSNTTDMTTGTPLTIILKFAIPIFIGNIFQQLYNLIDTIIAGHFLGDNAIAAIGATTAIYSLIINMANGLNNGYAIIVARAFGEKNEEKLRKSFAIMIVLNISASIVFTILSAIFIMPVLELLHTPEKIIGDAYEFIIIILFGIVITITYNMFAGLLRAIGNSRTPLIYLIISCVVNIILDFVFIVGLRTGVGGAALATMLSQLLSVILCFSLVIRKYPELKLSKRHFQFEKELVIEMFTTGISMGFMYSIFAIGSVVLQSAINGLGTAIITGHTGARKIVELCMQPLSTLSSANATFVSQNYGAGKYDRIKEGIRKTCLCGFIWSTITLVFIYLFAPFIIKAITGSTNHEVITNAVMNLRINMPFYYPLGVLLVLRTSLQGIGRKIAPLFSSSIELIMKCFATFFLVSHLGYLGVSIAEPSTWLVCMLFLLFTYKKAMKEIK
ncbi:MATE family efflux transporter [Anaeromicropila herbilytica]|uniref:MATE family efflux transporter n=1 Tax=Anaeromicropila herbilytica TaxID=2785025 RepID=A0A7R7ICE9_9FIRM|nr:MATE family efflux transporter [Anaeromicropila herbilytica]BCN30663.1 MATE family efflux transporter [Anaeromicropila herbilytica]